MHWIFFEWVISGKRCCTHTKFHSIGTLTGVLTRWNYHPRNRKVPQPVRSRYTPQWCRTQDSILGYSLRLPWFAVWLWYLFPQLRWQNCQAFEELGICPILVYHYYIWRLKYECNNDARPRIVTQNSIVAKKISFQCTCKNEYCLATNISWWKSHAPERHEALIPEWKDSKNVIITLRIPRIAKWILSVGHHCLVHDKIISFHRCELYNFQGKHWIIVS